MPRSAVGEGAAMTITTRFISTHAVAAYFALTFAISWGGVLLAIGGFTGMSTTSPTSDSRFVYALIAMLAGPSIAGILLTFLADRKQGLRECLSRALTWRVAARWYAFALLTAPLLWLVTSIALSLTSSQFLSGIVTSADKPGRVQVGLAVALGAGIFEELGWTGFAIPRLRRRHGVFVTGLVVGVLWGAWHLLTSVFWAGRVSAGDLALSVFVPVSVLGVLVGYLAAFRVLMVWVYDRTGSLLVAMLMHVSLTASVLILDPERMTGTALLTYSFALAVAVWTAVALIAALSGGYLVRRPVGSRTRAA
jgi:membrane protease YdiL (CAAX protease family)